jgi:hypothetical protein
MALPGFSSRIGGAELRRLSALHWNLSDGRSRFHSGGGRLGRALSIGTFVNPSFITLRECGIIEAGRLLVFIGSRKL